MFKRQGCVEISMALFQEGRARRKDMDKLLNLDHKKWRDEIVRRLQRPEYTIPYDFENKIKNIRLRNLTVECISTNIHTEFTIDLLTWMCHKKEALIKYRAERCEDLRRPICDVFFDGFAAVVLQYVDQF
jgi:hypothetical protein